MDDSDFMEEGEVLEGTHSCCNKEVKMREKTTCLWIGAEPPTELIDEDIRWNYAVDEIITAHFEALSDSNPGDEEDIKSDLERLDKMIVDNDIRVFAGTPSLKILCHLYKMGNEKFFQPILIPQYVWDTHSESVQYDGFKMIGLDRIYLSKIQAMKLFKIAHFIKENDCDNGCEFSLYKSGADVSQEISHGNRGSIKVKGFVVNYSVLKQLRCHPLEEAIDGYCYHITILRDNIIVGTLAGAEAKEAIQIIMGEDKKE